MKKLPTIIAILIALLLGYAWGFSSHRNRSFPYGLAREVANMLRIRAVKQDAHREQIKSRSETAIASLAALGYVEETYDPEHELRGVVSVDRERVFPGPRFYHDNRRRKAYLIDTAGESLHEWSSKTKNTWDNSLLLPDGDVIFTIKDRMMVRMDRRSRKLWSVDAQVHHGVHLFDDMLYVLTRRQVRRPEIHPTEDILEDLVTRYTPDGKPIDSLSVLDVLQRSDHAYLLPALNDIEHFDKKDSPDAPLDILHTNHVEVMDGSLADRHPIYARGNLLLCMRNINLIAIVDPDAEELLWAWGPSNISYPHHPRWLANGNILIFDNGLEASQGVEIDPLTLQMQWRFAEDGFFSRTQGSIQRLANGNTLLTESTAGYVWEVSPDGDTVWKWANPNVNPEGHRAVVARMTAYAPDATPFITSLTGGS
jgi:hypothetical protein